MPVFYDPQFSAANPILNATESSHAIRVLRLKTGDVLHVIDGRGSLFSCRISQVVQNECHLQIVGVDTAGAPADSIALAVAPPKSSDRMEWLLEKATEMGVDAIYPIICTRSERRKLRPDRLEKILVSATKQSQRRFLPKLHPLQPLDTILNLTAENKYIAYCMPQEIKPHLFKAAAVGRSIVLIGPEGDFSEDEVQKCLASGFSAVSLGENRLRTETAALAAVHALNIYRELH